MNPPCGRCNKPVYPTEKINCLDKYWHKGCFSCEVCKMALSMTTYKGFEKKPYCSMHYPKTSFTIVADTPENLRLKQQSLLNSQALYKEDFEKSKGKGFSVVVDTPEMQRLKKTQDQISNIKYHEDFEKSRVRSDAPPPENRQDYEEQPSNPQIFRQPAGETRPAAVAPPCGGVRLVHVHTPHGQKYVDSLIVHIYVIVESDVFTKLWPLVSCYPSDLGCINLFVALYGLFLPNTIFIFNRFEVFNIYFSGYIDIKCLMSAHILCFNECAAVFALWMYFGQCSGCCVHDSCRKIQWKSHSWDFELSLCHSACVSTHSEALPGAVQLRGGGSGRGFPPGGRSDPGRGAHRRGMDVRMQPAHGAAGHAPRQLRPARVKENGTSDVTTCDQASSLNHLLQIIKNKGYLKKGKKSTSLPVTALPTCQKICFANVFKTSEMSLQGRTMKLNVEVRRVLFVI
uniref:LIM and SH3 domain protein 1 n=1 Tax=Scophthalmus maximus TaxID=52904 RepID=A0A8D3D1P2_SCOMX